MTIDHPQKRGCFIVLAGVDGSGKSTAADLIAAGWRSRGGQVVHTHGRPTILPSPRRLVGQVPTCDPSKPHAKPPHHFLVSVALVLYYYLDFLAGYFGWIRRKRNCGWLVMNERYFYDLFFDPVRHRVQGVERLARLLVRALPPPDIVVFLHADPEVLYTRKPELPCSALAAQQELMVHYFASRSGVLSFDVGKLSASDVSSRVLAYLAGKESLACAFC
ncbi:MAG: hypothetical protein ABSD88_08125 [Candidatus Korobacteraceae bacterium]|jgi:thymidylate kinase